MKQMSVANFSLAQMDFKNGILYLVTHTGAKTHFLARNSFDFDASKM